MPLAVMLYRCDAVRQTGLSLQVKIQAIIRWCNAEKRGGAKGRRSLRLCMYSSSPKDDPVDALARFLVSFAVSVECFEIMCLRRLPCELSARS